jgi:hypothetical protein
MSCSCRKGAQIEKLLSPQVEELLKLLQQNPGAFELLLEVVNSFRPTDPPAVKAERIFLAVKDMVELKLLSPAKIEKVTAALNGLLFSSNEKDRGNLLEVLVSKLGPFYAEFPYRRVNQCKVFKKSRKLSDKEIDVAFSSKRTLELHECKSNMVRQWRDPLSRKSKRGGKLHFLNQLPQLCKNGKRVVPVCSGLDGEMAVEYLKLVFKFYRFKQVKIVGREKLLEKLKKKRKLLK